MSRELPILFNTEMVKAIMSSINPKTATRRIIKGFIPDDAVWGYTVFTPEGCISCRGTFVDGYGEKFFRLPCRAGDILYVRETWKCWRVNRYKATADIMYRAGGNDKRIQFANGNTDSADRHDYDQFAYKWHGQKWRPSIHMPKEAARIWLKVTDVRVERLQDISGQDVLKEGINSHVHSEADYFDGNQKEMFEEIWNATIKKADLNLYGWEANPWVWVIEFERCEKPAEYGAKK